MFMNERYFNLCSLIFLLTFLSSTAFFCSNLTSADNRDTPCFLESATDKPISLRTSGNSLVLPCHVARSKGTIVEWWYNDLQKLVNIKIYPVYPVVRPTVLRFVTSTQSYVKNSNETDIIDASILLRHANVDDSGIYRCVIRPWPMDPIEQMENMLTMDDSKLPSLSYHIQLAGPRLCQFSPGLLPCFSAMRTSSPTIIDAYQTAFLQCVVKSHNRRVNVFWVVGDVADNNVLITDYLTTNQNKGDKLRRIFPLSPFDHSIELTVNPTVYERVYSCVIEGATEIETTLFTYIVRTLEFQEIGNSTLTVHTKQTMNLETTTEHVDTNYSTHDNSEESTDETSTPEDTATELNSEKEDDETSTSD